MRTTNALLLITAVALSACGSADGGSGDAIDDGASVPAESSEPVSSTSTSLADDEPADTTAVATAPTADDDASTGSADTDPAGADADTEAATTESAGDDSAESDGADVIGVNDVQLTAQEQAAADNPIAVSLVDSFPPAFAPPAEIARRCIGGKIVDTVGADRLAELGITPGATDVFGATSFEPAEIEAIVDILFECVDVQAVISAAFAPGAPPETVDCYAGFFDEALLRSLAAPFLGGDELDSQAFLTQVQLANEACGPTSG